MRQIITVVSAIALISISGSAIAQAPAPAPGAPGVVAAPAMEVTSDLIVAALNNTQTEVGELGSLSPGATVELVELTSYLAGPDAAQINVALTATEDDRDALRTALEANPTIMAQLQSDVKIDNVVGADVSGDKILIFWQPMTDRAAANPPGGAAAAAPRP
jgi:hypothetical protein